MRGQHVSESESVGVSPEVAFHQRQAMDAALFWQAHLCPPGLDTHTSRLLLNTLVDCSVEGEDNESDAYFHPANNPVIGLVLALMAFEGALPYDLDEDLRTSKKRQHRDRIPSVELADLLGITPRGLAEMMRWADVAPRDIRFSHTTTKGYFFREVVEAWERAFGDFQRQVVEIELEKLERPSGLRTEGSARRREEMRRYLNGEWGDVYLNGWRGRRRSRALSG